MAIDSYLEDPENYVFKQEWLEEFSKASHREFSTGFFNDKPDSSGQVYDSSAYVRDYAFIGLVMDYDAENGIATVEQRNKMVIGDEIEIIGPKREMFAQKLENMWNYEGEEIESAPHPQMIVKIKMTKPVARFDILRRERKDGE
jgi:putative protease